MQPDEAFKNFISTFEIWTESLNNYSIYQLRKNPDSQSWSMGQVYMHLVEQTINYNIPQIEICISSNENAEKIKSPEGEQVFKQNSLPAIKLKSPASTPKQPENIEEIRKEFDKIKDLLTELTDKISKTKFRGKTNHPGFHYLNASEWLQFIDMHFRHHLHQKRRLDEFLNSA